MQIATMTSLIYSRRNTKEKVPFAESIHRLEKAGFSHMDLNLCGISRKENEFCLESWEAETEKLRKEAEDLGIRFIQSHAPYYPGKCFDPEAGEFNDHFQKMLLRSAEICHKMGIRYSVIHPVKDPRFPPEHKEAHLKITYELHRHFLEKCREYGISPAFENMPGQAAENRFGRSSEDLIMICDALQAYHTGICWDFGHGNLSFEDQTDEIPKMAGRITCVHVHDNRGKNDDHLMPFMGNIPWEKVLPAMKKTGFKSDLVLEVGQNGNMPDELKDESTMLCAHASRILIRMFEKQLGSKKME